MKLISWNVNGIRACLQKGFEDAFRTLNADFFCIRSSWTCRATGSTGTPPRRRATPARRSLPGTSRSP